MWHINEALKLIEEITPKVREFGYHVCLGGSVLYAGESENDLDLYFLPLEPDQDLDSGKLIHIVHPSRYGLELYLTSKWGLSEINADYGDSELYKRKLIYSFEDKKVDVFIV